MEGLLPSIQLSACSIQTNATAILGLCLVLLVAFCTFRSSWREIGCFWADAAFAIIVFAFGF